MKKVLIIDDEKEIVDLMEKHLQEAGYVTKHAYDGETGLDLLSEDKFSIIILDVMMPGMNGLETCELIRKEHNVPVIIVSAKGQDEDKIRGLEIGADDYMVKPFSMNELVARVHSQIRRFTYLNQNIVEKNRLEIKGLSIDEKKHQVFLYGQVIKLTPTEYDILLLLMENRGQVFSSEEIYRRLWKEKYYEGNNTVMSHMWRLREKIEEDSKNPKIIETVWGVGYKIEG